ncbi:MAG: hypothetical protein NTY19_12725 [Planctomycetota bacterium]|nr:hypothetical protein [Planctomycetota bacterium]
MKTLLKTAAISLAMWGLLAVAVQAQQGGPGQRPPWAGGNGAGQNAAANQAAG